MNEDFYSELPGALAILLLFFAMALFLVLNTIAECRTIVLSKSGCEITWWKFRKFWTWDEMKYRRWVKYPKYVRKQTPMCGNGVIWLCTTPVMIPSFMDASAFASFSMMNRVGIHLFPKGRHMVTQDHYFSFAVDKDTFMRYIDAIGLWIDNLDDATCFGE